jgi:uncharacterized membrane protein YeaQ/YmgE (transglycosylase-associated protein family)
MLVTVAGKIASMLNILGWLVLGALIGWLGSLGLTSRRSQQFNLVTAMFGAVLGGLSFSWDDLNAVVSGGPAVNLSGLFITCLGAISVLTIAGVVRHGRVLAPVISDERPASDEAAPLANRQL